ncbi:MAG: putative two-component system response regulator [Candidatus Sulfotelmatobacter sp.]|nr:putative two-component system response regulator [Candidatus Sulfotelmatobacter sp.]
MNTLKRMSDSRARGAVNVGRLPNRFEPISPESSLEEILRREERLPKQSLSGKSQHRIASSHQEPHFLPEPIQSTGPLNLMVADDHPVVREGLVAMIERQPNMRVIAQASNGREAVDNFLNHRPDVGLLDLRMPVMNGVDAVVAICEKAPTARLIILTTYQVQEDIYRALRAGALGYVLKDAPAEELVDSIRAVSGGRTWIPPAVGAMLAKRLTDRELTARETEVLGILAIGKSNKEIGVAFNISEATVKVHVTHILEKLKVTGRTEAINVAVRRGLVNIDSPVAA